MDTKPICGNCNKTFFNKSSLQRHVRTLVCKKVAKHRCPVCEAAFMQKRQMLCHIKKEHERNAKEVLVNQMCPKCGKVFHRESTMRLHLKNNICELHPKRIHSCPICCKSYTRNDFVLRHMRAKHPEAAPDKKQHRLADVEGYRCCDESFANGREYRTHKDRVHIRRPEVPCRFCGAKFRCGINMYNHVRIVHDKITGDLPKCRCVICFVPPRSAVSAVFEQYSLETTLVSKEIPKGEPEKELFKPVEYFDCVPKCGKRFRSDYMYRKHSDCCWIKKKTVKKARQWDKERLQSMMYM